MGLPLDLLVRVLAEYIEDMSDATRILAAIEQGDGQAAEALLPLVYDVQPGAKYAPQV